MKKILSLFLAILFCLLTFNLSAMAADERTGIVLEREALKGISHPTGYYFSEKRLEEMPVTFEAWVYIPTDAYAKSAGIVLGNSLGYEKDDTFSFEIAANGVPRLYLQNAKKENADYSFTKAVVPANKWTHVSIVYGTGFDNEQVYCYINGEFKEATELNAWFKMNPELLQNPICLAGDYSRLNEKGFKGTLGDVAVYSDVRTADEIAKDAKNAPDVNDKSLLMYYDLDAVSSKENVPDSSKNGYDMQYYKTWLTEEEMQAVRDKEKYEYTYTIAFMPDTQYSTRLYPKKLPNAFDYLIKNVNTKNIKYVIALGDMTDQNGDLEWQTIKKQYDRLDGILPYSLIRGNHDALSNGGSRFFEKYYNKESSYYNHVKTNGGFFKEDNAINTYLLFDVGEVKYIIVNLDFGAKDDILTWANKVLSEHSDRRAIIVTHGYLNPDGRVLTANDYATPSAYQSNFNDGDDMWNKLISKHENVDMVVAGHMSTDDVICRVDVGEAGNEVYQLLMDPQSTDNRLGGMGLVALMYFTEDGNHARVEYYSSTFKRYFREANNNVKLHFAPEEETQETEFGDAPGVELTNTPVIMDPVPTQGTAAVPEQNTQKTDNSGAADTTANEGGCGSSVSLTALAFAATLVTCAVFVTKKKED